MSVVERLLHSTYVDDVVSGANSEKEAFELFTQAKKLFRRGGFNLRKFLTYSKELQLKINQAEGISCQAVSTDPSTKTYAQAVLGTQSPTEPGKCKILGILWNSSSDHLVFDVSELAQVATTLQPKFGGLNWEILRSPRIPIANHYQIQDSATKIVSG